MLVAGVCGLLLSPVPRPAAVAPAPSRALPMPVSGPSARWSATVYYADGSFDRATFGSPAEAVAFRDAAKRDPRDYVAWFIRRDDAGLDLDVSLGRSNK